MNEPQTTPPACPRQGRAGRQARLVPERGASRLLSALQLPVAILDHGRRAGLSPLAGGPAADESEKTAPEVEIVKLIGQHRLAIQPAPRWKRSWWSRRSSSKRPGAQAEGHRRGRGVSASWQEGKREEVADGPRSAPDRKGGPGTGRKEAWPKDAGISTRPIWHRPTPTGSRPGPTFPSTRSSSRTSRNSPRRS